jgi:hypothetical protein
MPRAARGVIFHARNRRVGRQQMFFKDNLVSAAEHWR